MTLIELSLTGDLTSWGLKYDKTHPDWNLYTTPIRVPAQSFIDDLDKFDIDYTLSRPLTWACTLVIPEDDFVFVKLLYPNIRWRILDSNCSHSVDYWR